MTIVRLARGLAGWFVQRLFVGTAVFASMATFGASAAELAISCSSLGREYEVCRDGVEAWARRSGHQVRLVSTPNSATERLALYQQLLAARAPDIDVFQIDAVWPGLLARHLVDLSAAAGQDADQHFPALIDNVTVAGRLVAMPWFVDAGLLYFRRDLLDAHSRPVPRTWEELEETARLIQTAERAAGRNGFWGYVFQGRAYEGLTVNALEWVASYGGGFVDRTGVITAASPQNRAALTQIAGFIGTIAPGGVLNYTEEESRGVFQAGNALFMRNWPYAWSLAQGADSPIRGKVGIAALPAGGTEDRHVGTLGGQQLAVSAYSRHPDLAIDLVLFLTGRDEQKRRAVTGSFNPTRPDLFEDAEVLAASPFMADLRPIFEDAVARPSSVTGRRYSKVSARIFDAVHAILADRISPEAGLERLADDLARVKRRGWPR